MKTYKAIYSAINGGWAVREEDSELGYKLSIVAKTGSNIGSDFWAERIANALNQIEHEHQNSNS